MHNRSAHITKPATERAAQCAEELNRRSIVNEQFTRQVEEFSSIPDNVQSMVEDGVTKTRDAYLKINAVTKDGQGFR
jgi:hypothetical protein